MNSDPLAIHPYDMRIEKLVFSGNDLNLFLFSERAEIKNGTLVARKDRPQCQVPDNAGKFTRDANLALSACRLPLSACRLPWSACSLQFSAIQLVYAGCI